MRVREVDVHETLIGRKADNILSIPPLLTYLTLLLLRFLVAHNHRATIELSFSNELRDAFWNWT